MVEALGLNTECTHVPSAFAVVRPSQWVHVARWLACLLQQPCHTQTCQHCLLAPGLLANARISQRSLSERLKLRMHPLAAANVTA